MVSEVTEIKNEIMRHQKLKKVRRGLSKTLNSNTLEDKHHELEDSIIELPVYQVNKFDPKQKFNDSTSTCNTPELDWYKELVFIER